MRPQYQGGRVLQGNVPVLKIANAVVAYDRAFCARAEACLARLLDDGWAVEKDEKLSGNCSLPDWKELPLAGGFKVARPGGRTNCRRVTAS